MKYKTLTILFGMIFLLGVLSSGIASANTLSDLSTTMNLSSGSVISGNSFLANFSFNYFDIPGNYNDSALIIKLNLTSSNQTDYPVMKNDFKINGYIEKCGLSVWIVGCLWKNKVYFSCSEENPTTINHSKYGVNIEPASNGIFYCFNESNDLSLNEGNNIFLDITPNIALWPGDYTINATLFYLDDTLAPSISILDKSYFNQYFKAGNSVSFEVEASDNVGLSSGSPFAKLTNSSVSTQFVKNFLSGNIYEFYQTLPSNLDEGYYNLTANATDTSGNSVVDSVILRTDETSPSLTLLEPSSENETYNENSTIYIKFNITDNRSGVNNQSVKCRLREIVEGIGTCPGTGSYIIGGKTCITTPWLNMERIGGTDYYDYSISVSDYNLTSASYQLDVKAEDNLGNKFPPAETG